jgi:superfamily II DNA/RNA helicase
MFIHTFRVLVVAPTRELAMQSHQVCLDVGGLKSVCIYGGMYKYMYTKYVYIHVYIYVFEVHI